MLGINAIAEAWLDADCMTGESLWGCVDRALADGQRVWLSGTLFDPLAQRIGEAHAGRMWLALSPRQEPPAKLMRVRDILLAGMALVILSPLFAVLALLVKRSSPGPVIYETEVI